MKELRRLDAAPPTSVYERLQRGTLRYVDISEAELGVLEQRRPNQIVIEGEATLVGQIDYPMVQLQYAYPDRDAFARQFPQMLARLLEALNADEAPYGLRLRLVEMPSRPYIEPVLANSAFELYREWLRMALAELPDDEPRDEVAPGFLLRQARPDDAEAIAELDDVAFPDNSFLMTPAGARGLFAEAPLLRVLENTEATRAVGYLQLRHESVDTGFVTTIALHPDYHRRGLGEALMHWAFAWFRSQGHRRVALTVRTSNAPAIALYRKLRFVTEHAGLDYRRPIDEEEARQVLNKRRSERISVRHRY